MRPWRHEAMASLKALPDRGRPVIVTRIFHGREDR
jgi:hypothetical protein